MANAHWTRGIGKQAEVALQIQHKHSYWERGPGLVLGHRCLLWCLKSQASLTILVYPSLVFFT